MTSHLTRIKGFFAPPIFPDDEDKTRTAKALNRVLVIVMLTLIASATIFIPFVFAAKLYSTLLTLVFFLMLAATYWLLRCGRVRLASVIFVCAVWILSTVFLFLSGGMTSIVATLYITGTVIAGLLLGVCAALVHTTACSLAGLSMAILEVRGYILPRLFPVPPLASWTTLVYNLLIMTAVLSFVLRSLKDALALTRQQVEERKRAEESLRRREHDFSTLVENAADMIVRFDADLRHVYCNPAVERQLGVPVQVFLGKAPLELDGPREQGEFIDRSLRQALETGEELDVEQDYPTPLGLKHFQTRIVPERDPGGRIESLLAITRDITDRKQAEDALRQTEIRFRSLVEHTSDAVFCYEYDPPIPTGLPIEEQVKLFYGGVLAECNDMAARSYGAARAEQVVGKRLTELFGTAPGSLDDFFVAFVQNGYRTVDAEGVEIAEDGTKRYYLNSGYGVVEGGMLLRVWGTFRNITDRKRAEEALNRSEAHLRGILTNSPDTIYTLDLSNREVAFLNREIFCGYSKSELQKPGSILSAVHPDDLAAVKENWQQNTAGPRMVPIEYRLRRKDGDLEWIEQRMAVLSSNPNGSPKELLVILSIVTDRRRAEEALRRSEKRFRALIENSADAISLVKSDGTVLYDSPSHGRMLGYSVEERIGQNTFELVHPDDREHLLHLLAGILQKPDQVGVPPTRVRHADGSWRWIEGVARNLLAEPSVQAIVVNFRDITERRQAEEEREQLLAQIREQAHRVQQIMDTVPEGVLLLDAHNRVILANPLGQKDLATLAAAQVGDLLIRLGDRPLAELLTSPPKGLWHEVAADRRFFQVIARPIEDGPTPQGWVLVVRDVTQQREVERWNQQQERLAAVGQLAAGIAHDFNNIMAVITLYAGMSLRTPDLPTVVYERLATIDQQARRASDLIQQILDFSRRAVLERGPMDMQVFLKEQVKLLERTLPEHIEVSLVYGRGDHTVNADPTRLQQAIMNLATNARDAMPEGGQLRIGLERVRVEAHGKAPLPDMEPGDWVLITVADSGAGISPDALAHIFEPFFTTKEPGQGTGLGLAQVHGIVRQHEGYIAVSTESGRGTTFSIYLPALAAEQPEEPAPRTAPLARGQGQTILVVEDHAVTRKALVDSLEPLGYRVLEAPNGREALAIFERHADTIALVLSDIVMPEMSGQALFRALRERNRAVKMVLLSGHPLREEELEELRAQGLADWLPKPPSLEQLAAVVARALEENGPGAG